MPAWRDRFGYEGGPKGQNRGKGVTVDAFPPNPWGLYQVHGNAFEWVEDCWHNNYQDAPVDGSAWTNPECTSRVVRGGSWSGHPTFLRSAYRSWSFPDNRISDKGFRLARTLSP